jgi:hypothetical protein
LEADKTSATGWGETEDASIPAFHPQFNDFRGYAYLEADDAADLPWNTTKTALDTEHPVYRRVLQEMIAIARPVVTFFNKMKQERDARKEADIHTPGPLESLFSNADSKPLEKITPRAAFTIPATPKPKIKPSSVALRKISFEREQVFDYYYNTEC